MNSNFRIICTIRCGFGRNFRKYHGSNNNDGGYLVEKYRALHFMQNNDSAFKAELKRAQAVVFYDRQPLIADIRCQKNSGNAKEEKNIHLDHTLKMVPYAEIKSIAADQGFLVSDENIALLDVAPMQGQNDTNEEFVPIIALSLRSRNQQKTPESDVDAAKFLAINLKGEFMDLRRAYFLIKNSAMSTLMAKAQALLRWSSVFKFCPKCASVLDVKSSKSHAECKSCRQVFYPTISPVAITLISDFKNSNLLLVRQPRQVPGVYTAVAGFCEAGESLEDTVVRESAEEIGVHVTNIRYANISKSWPFPQNSLMCAFRASADMKEKISLDRTELEEGGWFSRQKVQEAFDSTVCSTNFFNVDFSKIEEKSFNFVPPFGTVAHELIKDWLRNQ